MTDKIIPYPIIRLEQDTVVEHYRTFVQDRVLGWINYGVPWCYAGTTKLLIGGGTWIPD